jgi:hypothetical protein
MTKQHKNALELASHALGRTLLLSNGVAGVMM